MTYKNVESSININHSMNSFKFKKVKAQVYRDLIVISKSFTTFIKLVLKLEH